MMKDIESASVRSGLAQTEAAFGWLGLTNSGADKIEFTSTF